MRGGRVLFPAAEVGSTMLVELPGLAILNVVLSMKAGVRGALVLQPAVKVLKPEVVQIPRHIAEAQLVQVLPA